MSNKKDTGITNANPFNNDADSSELLMWDAFNLSRNELEQSPEWKKHNLEYTLRSCEWLVAKTKNSDIYAQNLYAAMCNNEFVELDNSWDILKEEYWSVSWRTAGSIVANIIGVGDYIDWYCSGMSNQEGYVSESVITDEIKEDLRKLGWVCVTKDI